MINIDIIERRTNNEQRKKVNFFPSYLHTKSSSQFLFKTRITDMRYSERRYYFTRGTIEQIYIISRQKHANIVSVSNRTRFERI